MATVIQGRQKKSDVIQNALGQGIGNLITSGSESYMNRHDESALQKSIGGLKSDATPREILDAITNTKTYSPQAKQNVLKNYLGAAEFEELKRHAQANEEIDRARLDATKAKEDRAIADEEQNKIIDQTKQDMNRQAVRDIVSQLPIPDEKKKILGDSLSLSAAESLLKDDIKGNVPDAKISEKNAIANTGLNTIARMKEIGKKGNLGRGSNLTKFLGGPGAKDYGEYEQLGKSLIQLSTTIPIRNRQEFEVLAHKLYDPSIPDKEREGVLDAVESIIKGSIVSEGKKESRPPLSAFKR